MVLLSDELRMVLGLLTGIVVSLLAIPPIVRVSRAKLLGAVPNGRTSHEGVIPSMGGVALYASVVMGTSLFIDWGGYGEFRFVLAAILVVFFIGMKDDLINLNVTKKILAEITAALIVTVLADVRIESFHGILGIGLLPYWFSLIFSVFVIIALINCFNLLDGIDGLASGMGVVISLIFGTWLFMLGFFSYALLAFTLAGGLMSFFVFNVFGREHKLFMGDTGSLLLGFIFAILAIKIMCCDLEAASPLAIRSLPTVVMGVMIIPIVDTLRVFTLRILRGKSPFSADRTHLHHIFLQLGFTHLQASVSIIGMNLFLFGLAVAMRNLDAMFSVIVLITSAIAVSMVPCYFAKCLSVPAPPSTH